MGIREVLTAPRSPWRNAYVERLIGSIRRECLDHVIILNQTGLRRILESYFHYYQRSRTHLSLAKDAPLARPIQLVETGPILAIPQVGGLHHRYERTAAWDSLAPTSDRGVRFVPLVCTNGDPHTESQFILDAQGSYDIMELHERSSR